MRTRLILSVLVVGLAGADSAAAQAMAYFGYNVALSHDQIIISQLIYDPNSRVSRERPPKAWPGTLHVYGRREDGWERQATLQVPDGEGGEGEDHFGRFVIADGDRLIVGAPAIDHDGDTEPDGSVLVFGWDGAGWEYQSQLRPESVPPGSFYGHFASLSGNLLVVTAPYGETGGTAWVFERGDDDEWIEQAVLTPSDPAPEFERFGFGAHTDGERVIIGSFGGAGDPGAAYIFGRDANGEWAEEARLGFQGDEIQPRAAWAHFFVGSVSVSINGARALLGLRRADEGSGAVLVYERRSSGAWVRSGSLTAFDRQPGASFGTSISEGNGELWISAPAADRFGAIYAFEWDPVAQRFTDATKISPGDGTDVGDGLGYSVAVDDDLAVIGQPMDDGGRGSVVALERQDDGSWREVLKIMLPEERRPLAALADVGCDEGMADQFACDQVDILSFLPLDAIGGTDRGVETNDVWGWTDPQTGREYAIVGRTDGTAFVDVSAPESPVYLGSLPKTRGSATSSWRDIKVHADHAFVVADNAGGHGMQVFDLTRLRDAGTSPVTFEADAMYDGIASAHNIVINEETGTAYSVGSSGGGETCGGGLHMIDIGEPKNPTFAGCFSHEGTGFAGTGYTHDAQCVVYRGPDAEHSGKDICIGANENALSIADVTDRTNPVPLASAAYPAVDYAHQGWLTEDHRYFYQNDEGDEGTAQRGGTPMSGTRTLVWDLSDLDDPVLVAEHFGEAWTIDHNLYIVGDLMYQSNYTSGLRVLDISDRENPEEVGFFDTVPWDESVTFDGSWSNYPFFESGTIVVSSGKEGIFFLKYRRPELIP